MQEVGRIVPNGCMMRVRGFGNLSAVARLGAAWISPRSPFSLLHNPAHPAKLLRFLMQAGKGDVHPLALVRLTFSGAGSP